MPSTRITLALNSNRSQKCPLLIPSSASYSLSDPSSCRSLVIKAAQSKLRLKKASRVFVASSGQELLEESHWKKYMEDDVVLLVSLGEDFVGARKEELLPDSDITKDLESLTLGNPVYIMGNKAYIDPLSITQMETTARTLPGIIHAVGQPDLHPGTKFPIGAVFVSQGWIHPPLIGGDIGCGMAWYKTKLSASQVEGDKGRKVAEKLRGLEGVWRTQPDREAWLSETDDPQRKTASAGAEWDAALGTIGAGNHFAEIQVVEEVLPGAWQTSSDPLAPQGMLHAHDVLLLVHSGSRGYGGAILKRHSTDHHTSMRASDPAAHAYLAEHDRACAWAARNRDLIALRFLACLEPGDDAWALGLNDNDPQAAAPSSAVDVRAARRAVQARRVVDICHNSVERTSWPPVGPDSPSPLPLTDPAPATRDVYIHRKGAAPIAATPPSLTSPSSESNPSSSSPTATSTPTPLPLLPLPGSRGTPTLILHPLRTRTNAFGATNALSLAHGAGRALSRAKALAVVAKKYDGRAEDLLRGDFVRMDAGGNKVGGGKGEREDWDGGGRHVRGGTWVVCEDRALVWEEAPEAYKDVWDVGDDLVGAGAAERVGWCWGRVSYKVRRGES
ncbi:hypothetical protein MMC15_002457 [Xylographa vitiligo]|nr:hypothetical protein [Xylographa vitiligo]